MPRNTHSTHINTKTARTNTQFTHTDTQSTPNRHAEARDLHCRLERIENPRTIEEFSFILLKKEVEETRTPCRRKTLDFARLLRFQTIERPGGLCAQVATGDLNNSPTRLPIFVAKVALFCFCLSLFIYQFFP
jgi:hypothetical protein